MKKLLWDLFDSVITNSIYSENYSKQYFDLQRENTASEGQKNKIQEVFQKKT